MKRFILLLALFTFGVQAQNPNADQVRRALELRHELHKRLMDHLINGTNIGTGKDDELFKEMEALFEEAVTNIGGNTRTTPKSYDMAWSDSKAGRTFLLSPHDKKQPLEIKIEKGVITIEGKNSVASFTHTYSVPMDCDWTKVKMREKEGKIIMSFPFKKTAQGRKPVEPSKNDVSI
ncbi:MAG TPA: hypothetical protein VNJ08_07590 [Bacteriovoracaceae bacterium]|nr:hypothetical protein [Bacteriovoracaceae bacterium]